MTKRKLASSNQTRSVGWTMSGWLLGVFGGAALFSGLYVVFGPQDRSIGLGHGFNRTIGTVPTEWRIGLIVVGAALMSGLVALVILGRKRRRIETSPAQDVLVHAAVFIFVNGLVWTHDLLLGDGLSYALFATVPWAVGLAAHVVAHLVERRAVMAKFEAMLQAAAVQSHPDQM